MRIESAADGARKVSLGFGDLRADLIADLDADAGSALWCRGLAGSIPVKCGILTERSARGVVKAKACRRTEQQTSQRRADGARIN